MRRPGDLVRKDPASDEPFGFDWTPWLLELGPGVVIATSTWSIIGPDANLTMHDAIKTAGDMKTLVHLAGGTLGAKYTVTNHVETNSSPVVIGERSFPAFIEQQ